VLIAKCLFRMMATTLSWQSMATAETNQYQSASEYRKGEFVISTDRERLDLDVVHGFLTECYWAKGIPREIVARSIENSLCFGVYDGSAEKFSLLPKAGRSGAPKQVGFARVISDFATYAYIGDVFILDEYRGRGLGKWLMECIMQYPRLRGLRRWSLVTRDAHQLYAPFGFTPLKTPDRYMELHNPEIYESGVYQRGKS
jgi:GNAT superfamily N-acetyltransferase